MRGAADLPLGLAPVEQVAKERKAAYKAQEAARKKEEAARVVGQITMLDDSVFAGAMHTASGMMRLIEDLAARPGPPPPGRGMYRDSVRAVTDRARSWATSGPRGHLVSPWMKRCGAGCRAPAARRLRDVRLPAVSTRRAPSPMSDGFPWELEFPEVSFEMSMGGWWRAAGLMW